MSAAPTMTSVASAAARLRRTVRVLARHGIRRARQSRCCHPVCGFRYAEETLQVRRSTWMRVLIVEDEPLMAGAIRDGLRLAAIAADVAGDGNTALDLLNDNAYDIAVL